VKTLEEMERTGTFRQRGALRAGTLEDIADPEIRARVAGLQSGPDRFLAWMAATLSGSVMVAGEMGSVKQRCSTRSRVFCLATRRSRRSKPSAKWKSSIPSCCGRSPRLNCRKARRA
jgi:hypothetical protein